jgi:hypothetical protein
LKPLLDCPFALFAPPVIKNARAHILKARLLSFSNPMHPHEGDP